MGWQSPLTTGSGKPTEARSFCSARSTASVPVAETVAHATWLSSGATRRWNVPVCIHSR